MDSQMRYIFIQLQQDELQYYADTYKDSTKTKMDGAKGKRLHYVADQESYPANIQALLYLQNEGGLACSEPILLTRI